MIHYVDVIEHESACGRRGGDLTLVRRLVNCEECCQLLRGAEEMIKREEENKEREQPETSVTVPVKPSEFVQWVESTLAMNPRGQEELVVSALFVGFYFRRRPRNPHNAFMPLHDEETVAFGAIRKNTGSPWEFTCEKVKT